jgi:hypothetical protein
LRLADACDVGRPGGGPGVNLVPVGVLGAEPDAGGTKLDRTRGVDLLGGEVLRSIVEVGVASVFGGTVVRAPVIPGEAVCGLDGGGGGTDLVAVSPLSPYRLR